MNDRFAPAVVFAHQMLWKKSASGRVIPIAVKEGSWLAP